MYTSLSLRGIGVRDRVCIIYIYIYKYILYLTLRVRYLIVIRAKVSNVKCPSWSYLNIRSCAQSSAQRFSCIAQRFYMRCQSASQQLAQRFHCRGGAHLLPPARSNTCQARTFWLPAQSSRKGFQKLDHPTLAQ